MKKAIALSSLPLVLLFSVAFVQSDNSVLIKLAFIQSDLGALKAKVDSLAANNKGPRQFYLTKTNHTGAEALTACDVGYHMASMWEIFDPTTLRYNTELGVTRDDSGFGPPSEVIGWIRTGNESSVNVTRPNCNSWTQSNVLALGTTVSLDLS